MSTLSARIYMDYNATAPVCAPSRQRVLEVVDVWGNPSSLHHAGRQARAIVENARDQVGSLLGWERTEIVFTSGGTEADQLGILATAKAALSAGFPRIIARTSIDHPALMGSVQFLVEQGWRDVVLPVSPQGLVDVSAATDLLTGGVGVLALSWVNHELGTIAPVAALSEILRRCGGFLHVDAVQAAGRLDLRELARCADAVAVSAHKIGGIKGVGALALRAGQHFDVALPWIAAGHQERERRPGTENLVGIAAFGAAAQYASDRLGRWGNVERLGQLLEDRLRQISANINGGAAPRVGGTINASFPGARGDSIVMALDIAGVAVSTGAACTSGSTKPSAVLMGLGQSVEQSRSAVRFSLGHDNTVEELTQVADLLPRILQRARHKPANH
jgi:cysteine desulfurase